MKGFLTPVRSIGTVRTSDDYFVSNAKWSYEKDSIRRDGDGDDSRPCNHGLDFLRHDSFSPRNSDQDKRKLTNLRQVHTHQNGAFLTPSNFPEYPDYNKAFQQHDTRRECEYLQPHGR